MKYASKQQYNSDNWRWCLAAPAPDDIQRKRFSEHSGNHSTKWRLGHLLITFYYFFSYPLEGGMGKEIEYNTQLELAFAGNWFSYEILMGKHVCGRTMVSFLQLLLEMGGCFFLSLSKANKCTKQAFHATVVSTSCKHGAARISNSMPTRIIIIN